MAETVKGLKNLLQKLDKLPKRLDKEIEATVQANAQEVERNAKRAAPIDTGKLRQSIKALKTGDKTYGVFANATGLAPYAPYIEFGTGGLVDVPAELQDIAIRFKGKGVKQINLRPRPYLYPALVRQRKIFAEDLEAILERETGKI